MTDLSADPTSGPTEALFDKSLLSPAELADVEGVAYRSLGKFPVADIERFLDRLLQQDIHFELKEDDAAMSQMMPATEDPEGNTNPSQMTDIFVHPDDVEKALEITGEGNQV